MVRKIFICKSDAFKNVLSDGYGASADNVRFLNSIGQLASETKCKPMTLPLEVVNAICETYSDNPGLKAAIMSVAEIDVTTHGLGYDENRAIIELVKILSTSSWIYVVTDDKVLQQSVVELGNPQAVALPLNQAVGFLH